MPAAEWQAPSNYYIARCERRALKRASYVTNDVTEWRNDYDNRLGDATVIMRYQMAS
jgi:surface antigen